MVFLYDQLFQKRDVASLFIHIQQTLSRKNLFLITVVLALVPENWFFEAYKWRYLIRKLENISITDSFKAVLTGISVSMFLPNRAGDYLGRIFILKKANRLQAVLSTMLGGLAQLITTLIFGTVAFTVALSRFFDMSDSLKLWSYIGVVFATVIFLTGIIFIYLNFSTFSGIIKNISGKEYPKISKYSQVFSWYNSKELFNVLLVSMVRYLIFSFQFYLLLLIFDVNLSYLVSMILIGIVYLMMTVIPTIAMTELGVRGSVSIYVFGYYFESLNLWSENLKQSVMASSSLLWIINLGIPALVGAFFVFKLRFFRNGNRH
jgi:uncharacterized membrane protein YbhN (UPF0104 family)